jgi:hypothetical protein
MYLLQDCVESKNIVFILKHINSHLSNELQCLQVIRLLALLTIKITNKNHQVINLMRRRVHW